MPDPKVQTEAAEPAAFAPAAARVGADDRDRILRADPLEAQVRPASLSDRLAAVAREFAALCRGANSPSASSTSPASRPNGVPANVGAASWVGKPI